MELSVQFDTTDFSAFANRTVAALDAGPRDATIGNAMMDAQQKYLGFMRQRFMSASHGDGTWEDLAPSTKLRRFYAASGNRFKGGERGGHVAMLERVASARFPILYVTGTLYTSLYPAQPGNVFSSDGNSVKAGTAIPFAHFHQEGAGRLPMRRILVEPTGECLSGMEDSMVEGVKALLRRVAR